jgi:protein-S-isoprenylcysteine O-methyltransferase Ste14
MMQFLPAMKMGWLNGWIPILGFYLPFGFLMLTWPKDIVKKLYAISGWSKTERTMSLAGKPFALTTLGLVIFTPLKLGQSVFLIGGIIFLLGMVVMFVALFDYRNTPSDQAVERGLYRYSRNPQWFGLMLIFIGSSVMVGSGLAVLCMLGAITFYHFRILGEERACLAAYGDAYQEYMKRVPRYFAFL